MHEAMQLVISCQVASIENYVKDPALAPSGFLNTTEAVSYKAQCGLVPRYLKVCCLQVELIHQIKLINI